MLCRRREINVVDWLRNRFAGPALDSGAARGHKRPVPPGRVPATPKADQTDDMSRSDFYLVERPDPKYGAAHIALRQTLLSDPENRHGAGLRTPVGDLCGRERRLDDAARLVWLAASHGRFTANRRELRRPRVGIAAPAEFDRHAASLASAGLDLGRQCAASGDRRLRSLEAGRLKAAAVRAPRRRGEFLGDRHRWARPSPACQFSRTRLSVLKRCA